VAVAFLPFGGDYTDHGASVKSQILDAQQETERRLKLAPLADLLLSELDSAGPLSTVLDIPSDADLPAYWQKDPLAAAVEGHGLHFVRGKNGAPPPSWRVVEVVGTLLRGKKRAATDDGRPSFLIPCPFCRESGAGVLNPRRFQCLACARSAPLAEFVRGLLGDTITWQSDKEGPGLPRPRDITHPDWRPAASTPPACELFRTPHGVCYALIEVGSHIECWPVRSPAFRQWLLRRHWKEDGKVPSKEALDREIDLLDAQARFEAPERPAFHRVAHLPDGSIALDLGDPAWRCVVIGPDGWRVCSHQEAGIAFKRSPSTGELPEPQPGGSLNRLWEFVNVPSDDRPLVIGWLLASLTGGPYFHLVLSGPQGAGKSFASRVLKALIDPVPDDSGGLHSAPADERDLLVAAEQAHILAFDNLGPLPGWLSDALCRLSTGGSLPVRRLYTDAEMVALGGRKPCILNAIPDLIARPDLADRSLVITLEPPRQYRPERLLWEAFLEARPAILGALLDRLAGALRVLPQTPWPNVRMSDAARLVLAAEIAAGEATGEHDSPFLSRLRENRRQALLQTLEASPIIGPLLRLLQEVGPGWEGTANKLLRLLTERADPGLLRSDGWPKLPHHLSGTLRRLQPALGEVGVMVAFVRRGHEGRRLISLRVGEKPSPDDPTPDAADADADAGADAADAALTLQRQHGSPHQNGPLTLADAADADFATFRGNQGEGEKSKAPYKENQRQRASAPPSSVSSPIPCPRCRSPVTPTPASQPGWLRYVCTCGHAAYLRGGPG
jgi:hypothetical protein